MSTQLKEKQPTKSQEKVPTRDLQADFHFNQHIFRTIAYTAAGFGLGMASSLLFKHKAGMTIFFAGAGAGYGASGFANELQTFKNKRNPTEITRRQGGPSQFERTADNLKGDLQQAKNKVERGVENVGGKMADQVSQTARGAEEWARNASEKAQQHFQGKDYRRGGDDDKDDDKSKKRDQTDQRREQRDQRREGDAQKKDLKDQKKESESQKKQQPEPKKDLKKEAESLKKDLKDQKKESDSHKKDQKDQKKDADSQKKDQKKDTDSQKKDQKDQKKGERPEGNQSRDANATLKGGLSQTAKREEGSKEHHMIGNLRADQYTAKMPDQNAFGGYDSPKQQWEGMNIKREDKSKGGQDKTDADKNKTYNKDGQHFQDFKSNPNKLGAAGEISEIKKDYQRNRNQAQDEEMDARRRASKHAQQDLHGESRRQGNIHQVNVESETKQGFQNYQTGVAPASKTNKVEAKL